ncbi:unnamed protein product [Brassica oleracea var. botrytis]
MKELEQISVTTYNITSNAMMTMIFVGLDSALHTVSLRYVLQKAFILFGRF